ncbi:uncharacterized protein EAE97_003149 [Botrytis byssoidea]|uniref:Zn(2)-C6 fungal-type domain-containing protein n=1 Tax=Botrytis byssoidea TaxID=139641 RepID=A0A9P5M8B9_9HELO|nr:uncharacterized protein EAE97_003149 [Botrytis byssoidea]KAF7949640.1 hypothetical protein EAE97_003149 [Botrytis byssoidea]
MNQDSASSSTFGAAPVRKDRGPIASQASACDVCRQRKQRCDENRPKCGLCTRLKIDCNYREPVPTKTIRCCERDLKCFSLLICNGSY